MTIEGSASGKQCKLSAETQDETVDRAREAFDPVGVHLMERVLERDNLRRALNKVRSNKGGAGIDGMTVDELPGYLKLRWPCIREQLLSGMYRPLPVRTVLIPKGAGAVRRLGVPRVLDRFIQQALLEAMGQSRLSRLARAGRVARAGLEHCQVGPRAVAIEPQPGARVRYDEQVLRRPWPAHLVTELCTVTQSSEPPYTCSVCAVVWEEGHREVSSYPD